MTRLVLVALALAASAGAAAAQPANPLWQEQKVKNYLPHMTWPEVRDLLTRSDESPRAPFLGHIATEILLDAVLIVDTYPAIRDPVRMLGFVRAALKPTGLVGIVDFTKDGAGGPGPSLSERLDPEKIRRDAEAAGLTFRAHHTFLRYQYLLVFGR